MSNLTIVIPNRSRDFKIVSRSLTSINEQWIQGVKVVVVDYGSTPEYQSDLNSLIASLRNIEVILCSTQGQLWNKSRCINMVLKTCVSTYLMVCDMDMIWHPQALQQVLNDASAKVNYYQVGFLDRSTTDSYNNYETAIESFKSSPEATGIAVFPVKALKEINGFDEFYHGWGSEDTDAHLRLEKAGYEICFHSIREHNGNESRVLFKHQWHEKAYRSKLSSTPYHDMLEQINQSYLQLTKELDVYKANISQKDNWGIIPLNFNYDKLENPDVFLTTYHIKPNIAALIFKLNTLKQVCVSITIYKHDLENNPRTKLKSFFGKKTPVFIGSVKSNQLILELLINRFRNCPYRYNYDVKTGEINLVLNIID